MTSQPSPQTNHSLNKAGLRVPRRLRPGACIGVFTPSSPLNTGAFAEKFQHGVRVLENMGFRVRLGSVTASGRSEGYRSAPPRERANEVMELFLDHSVDALLATVGGYNTSSLLEFLDFEAIAQNPKVVCGYSDVTSLHCALLTQAKLSTFYGPSVFASYGEWPEPPHETTDAFLAAVSHPWTGPRVLERPQRWSRHFRNAVTGEWKTVPRAWEQGEGWKVVRAGTRTVEEAPLFAFNLNTLLSHAGTSTFPSFRNSILLLEEMDAPLGRTERSLVHLARLGAFERVRALLWGRIETPDAQASDDRYVSLLKEFVPADIALVVDVDVSHTVPMLTLAQGTLTKLDAPEEGRATLTVLEPTTSEEMCSWDATSKPFAKERKGSSP